MKKNSFLIYACLGFILFTSCLGEGGHVVEYGSQAAVAQIEDEDIFLYITNENKLLPSNNLNLGTGECVLIDYKIDLDEKDVTDDARGKYSPITLTSNPLVLKDWLSEANLDTAEVLTAEQTVSSFKSRTAYLKDRLFLFTDYNITDSIRFDHDYRLSYYTDQEARTDTSLYKEKDVPFLQLFLRVTANDAGTRTRDKTQSERNAFILTDFVKGFREYAVDDTLHVRVKYAKSFNSDSTTINWGESSTIKLGLR